MSQTANNPRTNMDRIVRMTKAGISPKALVAAFADRGIAITEDFVATICSTNKGGMPS